MLLVVLLVASVYAAGAFHTMVKDIFVRTSTADAYTEVDTVVITNAKTDSLLVATATLAAPSQFARLKFSPATATAALRDTTRFVIRAGTGPVSDTLKLNVKLGAATQNGDTVILSFYADNGVKTDTVYTTEQEFPAYSLNIFESHLSAITNEESTGVVVNIQCKQGDWGDWNTIATHTLDLTGEEQHTSLTDSTAAGVPIGNFARAMIITYDSTRGARSTASKVEVMWRGRE